MLLPIHYKCNQGCIFCSAQGVCDEVEIEELVKSLNSCAEGRIEISGGEPFLAPDVLTMVVFEAKKRRLGIEILTNATLVQNNEKILKRILPHIEQFNVNMPAHNQEVDFFITKLRGAFYDRLRGVGIILHNGGTVRITHIINKYNYKHLADFVGFVKSSFSGKYFIQFSFVKGVGAARKNKDVMPAYEEVEKYLNEAMLACVNLGIEFIVDHIPLCHLGNFENHHVDAGKMIGGLAGDYQQEKIKISKCSNCDKQDKCSGVRKDYLDTYQLI